MSRNVPGANLVRMLSLVFAMVPIALLVPSAVSQSRSTQSEWRVFVGQANSADVRARAEVLESTGRGTLLLDACVGSVVTFADAPEGDFWKVDRDGVSIAWIRWKSGRHEGMRTISAEGGMEGWTFDFNTAGQGESLAAAERFYVCPSRDSANEECRSFATKGLKQAIRKVCEHSKRRQY